MHMAAALLPGLAGSKTCQFQILSMSPNLPLLLVIHPHVASNQSTELNMERFLVSSIGARVAKRRRQMTTSVGMMFETPAV